MFYADFRGEKERILWNFLEHSDISRISRLPRLLDLSDDCLHWEIEPLVEGDRAVAVLVHGGEHVFPVFFTKGRKVQTQPAIAIIDSDDSDQLADFWLWPTNEILLLLGSLGEDVDESDKLALVHLPVPELFFFKISFQSFSICIWTIDKFPSPPVSAFCICILKYFSSNIYCICILTYFYFHLSASAAWKAFQWRK